MDENQNQEIGIELDEYKEQEETERQRIDYAAKADTIWSKVSQLQAPKDDPAVKGLVEDVYSHLRAGNLGRAEAKLAALNKVADKVREKEAEKRARQKLAEMGIQAPDESQAGGGEVSSAYATAAQRYSRGEISREEFDKVRGY